MLSHLIRLRKQEMSPLVMVIVKSGRWENGIEDCSKGPGEHPPDTPDASDDSDPHANSNRSHTIQANTLHSGHARQAVW